MVWFLFGLLSYVAVNSYGHVGMVSSPNHTFSWACKTHFAMYMRCCYEINSIFGLFMESGTLVHGIRNTSGLLQSKLTWQETRSIHDSVNRQKKWIYYCFQLNWLVFLIFLIKSDITPNFLLLFSWQNVFSVTHMSVNNVIRWHWHWSTPNGAHVGMV